MQKQFSISNAAVNQIVSEFQAGKEERFTDLFSMVHPFIVRKATEAARRTGVPADEFESRFVEALWTATEEWDSARSDFMQRFVRRMEARRIDLLRSYNAQKNMGVNFGALSLDKQVGDEDGGSAYVDLLEDENADVLPRLIQEELHGEIAETLRRFFEKNARYAKAVLLKVGYELEGEELAQALGFTQYDQNARQLVSRAVAAFRRFAQERLAA